MTDAGYRPAAGAPAPRRQDVVNSREGASVNQRGDAGSLGRGVHLQALLRAAAVVAHIHVIDASRDRGLQQSGRPRTKRPHTLQHQIHARHLLAQIIHTGPIEIQRDEARARAQRLHHGLSVGSMAACQDQLGVGVISQILHDSLADLTAAADDQDAF